MPHLGDCHLLQNKQEQREARTAACWQQVAANALTALIFAGAGWVVWLRSARTLSMGDTTATLEIRIGPFQQAVAVLLALTALAHLVLAWRAASAQEPRSA